MSALTQTLGELLLKTADEAQAVLESPALDEVRSRLAARTNMGWPVISGTFAQALQSALDVKLLDVLCGGWTKLVRLQAYLDRDRYPPTELCPFPLVQHTIRSVHHPGVDILLNEKKIEEITFDLEFLLTLEGIVLTIRDGRIVAIAAGAYAGGAVLKYKDFVLCETHTPQFEIPGVVQLEEGIAIPRLW
jgi:hypothetical protein